MIVDCGEISDGDDWNYCDNDETEDKLPPFPNDWDMETEMNVSRKTSKHFNIEIKTSAVWFFLCQVDEILKTLNSIKNAGNFYFKLERYAEASHKYNKAARYYTHCTKNFKLSADDKTILGSFHITNSLNCAAVELKLLNYVEAKNACNSVRFCAIRFRNFHHDTN